MTTTSTSAGSLQIKSLAAPEPWEACLVPFSAFPLPSQEAQVAREFLGKLTPLVSAAHKLNSEVFIQFPYLSHGDGATRFTDHARQWKPEMGLGVWYGRQPPALWTMEEMQKLEPGEKLRPLCHKVLRITNGEGGQNQAREVMLGVGTILQILTPDKPDLFLRRAKEHLLPSIQERTFRKFPYYLPILEGKSVAGITREELEQWLCGASVYIRESVEDKGLLILSRIPLAGFLEKLGAHRENQTDWRISD